MGTWLVVATRTIGLLALRRTRLMFLGAGILTLKARLGSEVRRRQVDHVEFGFRNWVELGNGG